MKIYYRVLMVLLFCVVPFSAPVYAANYYTCIFNDINVYDLTGDMVSLRDDENRLTVAGILSGAHDGEFAKITGSNPNFSAKNKTRWHMARIENKSGKTQNMVISFITTFVPHADFYIPEKSGKYRVYRAGLLDDKNGQYHHIPHHFAHITLEPGEKATIYLRTVSPFSTPYSTVVQTQAAFENTIIVQYIFFGFGVGAIAVMAIYNLFLFFVLREISYFFYAILGLSLSILVASTKGLFLKIGMFALMDFSQWLAFWMWTAAIFAMLFMRRFLDIDRRTAPILNGVIFGYIAFSAVCLLAGVTFMDISGMIMVILLSLFVFSPLVVVIGAVQWRRGVPGACFFVIAWIFPCIALIIRSLTMFMVLPLNFFTLHSTDIGYVIENTLLSLALAYRIKIMREEKEKAQLATQLTLEKARDELETNVDERTRELQAANRELSMAKEAAENATALKDKFVAIVSHDLRSPLSGIIGMLDLMESGEAFGMDRGKMATLITRGRITAKGLVELIDKLLNISRIKTGKLVPLKTFVPVRSMVESYIKSLGSVAEAKGVRMINDIPENFKLFADAALLGEVTSNLISNSLKFTKEGDAVTIFVPEGQSSAIAVQDTGAGIPEKIIDDLFSHHVKTTMTGTEGERGTGLGLPYSHDIIEAHGGSITVESKEGEGSVFYVNLPRIRHIILLVDDQEAQREIMKEHLAQIADAAFVEAGNGQEAVQQMTETQPDIIITDLDMPVVDGYRFIELIKQHPRWKDIPVIVVTSAVLADTPEYCTLRERLTATGVAELVTKPIIGDKLISVTRGMLRVVRQD